MMALVILFPRHGCVAPNGCKYPPAKPRVLETLVISMSLPLCWRLHQRRLWLPGTSPTAGPER